MPDVEGPLVEAAKRYLKDQYGEDTVSIAAGQVASMSARMR